MRELRRRLEQLEKGLPREDWRATVDAEAARERVMARIARAGEASACEGDEAALHVLIAERAARLLRREVLVR